MYISKWSGHYNIRFTITIDITTKSNSGTQSTTRSTTNETKVSIFIGLVIQRKGIEINNTSTTHRTFTVVWSRNQKIVVHIAIKVKDLDLLSQMDGSFGVLFLFLLLVLTVSSSSSSFL